MKKTLSAISITPAVRAWLANSHYPRILHIFDHACNLINEHKEVLSIVTQQIGHGPFNLVVKDNIHFDEHLKIETPVIVQENCLQPGNLTIDITEAALWNPRPDWENLHAQRKTIFYRISQLPFTNYQPSLSHSLLSTFYTSITVADLPTCITTAKRLAGLGQGLTPSGDDIILGALYAAWIIHPPEVARILAEEVAKAAAPLTTSLSAAWLRSAGRGEAGILWHEFLDTLISADKESVQVAMDRVLAVGATSGADALSGFVGAFLQNGVKIQHG